MVKLKVGNDLNNMKSMEKKNQIRCHDNRIQQHTKILSTQNIPGISLRELRSIYARNYQLYASSIIHTF